MLGYMDPWKFHNKSIYFRSMAPIFIISEWSRPTNQI